MFHIGQLYILVPKRRLDLRCTVYTFLKLRFCSLRFVGLPLITVLQSCTFSSSVLSSCSSNEAVSFLCATSGECNTDIHDCNRGSSCLLKWLWQQTTAHVIYCSWLIHVRLKSTGQNDVIWLLGAKFQFSLQSAEPEHQQQR